MLPKDFGRAFLAVAIVILFGIALGRCGVDNDEREEAQQPSREILDLTAQQTMATAAIGSVVVGTIATCVSAIGLWGLLATLRETRNQAADTRSLTRAYVTLSETSLQNFNPGAMPAVDIRFTNTGQTPAFEVQCLVTVYFRAIASSAVEPARWRDLPDPSMRVSGAGESWRMHQPFSRAISAAEHGLILTGQAELGAIVRWRYRDIFGQKAEFVRRCHTWIAGPGVIQFVDGPEDYLGWLAANRE